MLLVAAQASAASAFEQSKADQASNPYDPIHRPLTLSDARIGLSAPVSPALTLMDSAGQLTIRHSGGRAASASLNFGPDLNGNFQTGAAVGFHPYSIVRRFFFEDKRLIHDEWGHPDDGAIKKWVRRPAALSNVFLGMTKENGNPGPLRLTTGMQLVLFEEVQASFDADFPKTSMRWSEPGGNDGEEVESVRVKNLPQCLEQAVHPARKDGPMDGELAQMKRYRIATGLVKAARQQQAEVIENRIGWCRERALERLWNASSVSIGGALTWLSETGGEGNFGDPGSAVWVTGAQRLWGFGQWLVGARYANNRPIIDSLEGGAGFGKLEWTVALSSQLRIDVLKVKDARALLVLDGGYLWNEYESPGGRDRTGRLAGGLEYKLGELSLRVMIGGGVDHDFLPYQTFVHSTFSVEI